MSGSASGNGYVTSAGRAAQSLASARIDRVVRDKPEGYNWIRLAKIAWTDPLGRQRAWEMAERCHAKSEDEVDGVAIVCLVHNGKRGGEPPDILFVSQYRPPVAAECIEVPAGLIDKGEDAVTAALRELEEETGFVVGPDAIQYVSSPCPVDPGMTNADMRWVVVNVDGTDPRHHAPQAKPDDGEFIKTHRVPVTRALEWFKERENEGMVVDARLYGLFLSLSKVSLGALSPPLGAVAWSESSRTLLVLMIGVLSGSFITRLLMKR